MKILYSYAEGKSPVYIEGSNGLQRLLLSFTEGNDTFVYFCDDYLRHTYLNKVINTSLSNIYATVNFKKIESDTEFYFYLNYITNNYNYDGSHIEEKISGHDQGGAVLVDLDGKPLIK